MTPHTALRPPDPAGPSLAEAARRLTHGSGPSPLGAWREVARTGTLTNDPDPGRTAAGLVRRWHQHLAVAIDLPMERLAPGPERLPELVTAWLDLARRTSPVRAYIAATSGPRAAAEAVRQRDLLAGLLADDLALLDAPLPRRAALDLLGAMDAVAAAEDEVGRVLPELRAALPWVPPSAPLRRGTLPRSIRRLITLRWHATPQGVDC